jgi:hypothetical protein
MIGGSSAPTRLWRAAALALLMLVPALPWHADEGRAAAPDLVASTELIDPDCDPEKAENADPALVQAPDGVCPPGESDPAPPLIGAAPNSPLQPKPKPKPGPRPQAKPKQEPGARHRGGSQKEKKPKGEKRGQKNRAGERPPRGKRKTARAHPAPPALGDILGGCGSGVVPPGLAPIYVGASRAYQLGPSGPAILAAINEIESGFGANMGPSSAGAIGWMQFMPATWAAYGVDANGDGSRNPWEPEDAIFAAARYLRAAGMPANPEGALWAYNHAGWYVADVLHRAQCFGATGILDPLPPARRLHPAFAATLKRVADRSRVAWEPMLALLRARGKDGPVPASRAELRMLARRLAARGARRHPRRAVRLLAEAQPSTSGVEASQPTARAIFGDRVVALAHYNRAVGLRSLVQGLEAEEQRLARRVLRSRHLEIYPGGRIDVKSGVTEVRVLVLLLYLSSRYSEVTVTSLTTGHDHLTASGNVSAHSHGLAVDIAALEGTPILGHQELGGPTERALHRILLLPKELRPSELISLLDVGGPSFALADHADHIHVGY